MLIFESTPNDGAGQKAYPERSEGSKKCLCMLRQAQHAFQLSP